MTRHRTSRGWPLLFGFLLALQILSADAASVAQENDAKAAATRDYAVALGFQKKKLYEPAATRWANFLKTYPGDERVANVHYHLGVCRFRLKQLPEALAEFTTVVTKHPQSQYADAAQFNLGLVRYNQALESKKPEDFQQAAAQFAAVPAKFAQSPNVPAALYYQGECLVQGGDAKAAVEVYRKLLAGHPNSELMPDAHYALATTQQQLEQHADAAATLTAFLQKFAQHELAPECRLRLGMAQLGQEKFAEAEQTLAAAAAIKDFPLADFALLERGRALVGLKREADAAAVYESIPKQLPESQYVGPALLAAGKSRFRAGQFPEADADFAALVAHPKKLPQAPEAAYWRGRALVEQKKPADAVQVYDQALAGYPQSEHRPDLIFGRIDALYEQPAQRPQTVGLYAEFAAQHAEHEKAPRALYRAALTALELADHAAGRKHADAFLANAKYVQHEVAPDVVYVGAECAVRGEQPDFARGETLFRQLLSRWPEHRYVPQARIGVGFCLHGAAKHDEAVAWLNQQVGALKEPAHQAEARYLMGLSHHAAGRPKEAVPAFRAALAANPQAPNADEMLYALALSLRADAQPEPAAAELAKLAANHKQSAWRDEALFALGDIAHERGQHDAAATHFRQLVAEHAQSELAPQAQYRVGLALFDKGDFPNAAAELSKVLTAHAQAEIAPRASYVRGLCYQRLKDYPKALEDLNRFLAGKPAEKDALDARFAVALCQSGQEQHRQAATTLSGILQAKPDYHAADEVHYELAHTQRALKQEPQAAETFRTLATKFPESERAAEAWFRVGEFHQNAEELPKAAEAFAAGLKAAKPPELRETLFYALGKTLHDQAKFAEAAATFQEQLKEQPAGKLAPDATWYTAESLYRQAKFAESLPWFAKLIAANDERFGPRALYRSGDAAAAAKQWAASEQHYRTLIEKHPKFPQLNEARYGLGWALQNQQKFDPARQVYEEVTKATGTETAAKARFMMGECSFAEKKYADALAHFITCYSGYPYKEWQALAHFEAARCFQQLEQPVQARESLETLIEKFPEHERVKDAKAMLSKLK